MNRSRIVYFVFACLFLLIVLVGISILSNTIYDNSTSVQPSKVTKNDRLKEKQQISDTPLSLNDRLRQANLENGRKIFRQCALCHTSGRHESSRVGPALWGIVDRPLAARTDFVYSRILRANSDQRWNFVALDRYLQSPREAFPGTIMSFPGIKNDQDRADLLLYLRGLSADPIPLPMDKKEDKPG
ncbi:c-type cytochrome [Bartonella koehlerae]|uniref:Cytochrome c domain-containing protein n=1 Tax=Bartonella koehlerae C-29 TaxID=1134510 RepID=A0A067WA24_9HYPH|nr:c-type cytochrome [Bartonella koehlerae]KEC55751.1 hypothetical protein O9A_00529 [Bartonella koehlerae C-29]